MHDGVGFGTFVSIESMLLMIFAPLMMTGIGSSPSLLVKMFRVSLSPRAASIEELGETRVVLHGRGRFITLGAVLEALIGLITILSSIGCGPSLPLWWIVAVTATMALSVFYACLLHILVVQPLLMRVNRALKLNEE